MTLTEGLGLSSFRLPVATVRDLASWTIECHREFDRSQRESYVRSCLEDANWWRRKFSWLGVRQLSYVQMEDRIRREISKDIFAHWRYGTSEPIGDAIDISKNLLKACDESVDGHVTITVRDFSYLAVRPKRKA